jgi:hypothetical protein
MRWKSKINFYPIVGTQRTVEKFLLFPTKIDGETRWMEHAKIIQMYFKIRTDFGSGESVYGWKNIEWVDK